MICGSFHAPRGAVHIILCQVSEAANHEQHIQFSFSLSRSLASNDLFLVPLAQRPSGLFS